MREESAVLALAESGFLADEASTAKDTKLDEGRPEL
jgi:hypothetical protein